MLRLKETQLIIHVGEGVVKLVHRGLFFFSFIVRKFHEGFSTYSESKIFH